MDSRTQFENQLSDLEVELFRKSEALYDKMYAEYLQSQLTTQSERIRELEELLRKSETAIENLSLEANSSVYEDLEKEIDKVLRKTEKEQI